MRRLATGIQGFDGMVQGGLPVGSSVILQGPPGQEKLSFALTFLAEGLKAGASGLVIISSQSPDAVLAELRNLGIDLDAVTNEHRLRIVDWYSWSEESVQDIEERGLVVRSSIDLTNLGVALSRAIASLSGDQPRRAVLELLSPATNVYEITQVYAFAQSAKKKFDRYGFTSLVLLEKDMHSGSEITTLHQPFDGVIEIERTRSGDRIVRKIGVLHLKDTAPDPTFRELQIAEAGMRVVREAPKPATAAPAGPAGAVLESQEERARRLTLIMQIARERLKLDPRDTDALFAMAAAQATLDDASGGLQSLERLSELDPNYPGLWVLKTKLHARLGETDRARQSRLRSQEAEPAEDAAAEPTVPCPMCETPVAVDATVCGNCGVKFTPARKLEDELEDLGHAAIQDMVHEGFQEEAPPAPPRKPTERRPPEPEPRIGPVPRPEVSAPPKPAPKPTPKKGLTNGLVLGRGSGRRTGMTNGLRGRTNGLRGRTNGLTNGLGRTNGLTNGLTNGVGRTNGLTNGLGRTNGLTNGLGRTNGLTNGLGRTNGITNGLGRTNGLTNGLGGGRPSGFRSTGFRGMMQTAGWKLYVIPLVVVGLLLMPLFFVPEYQGTAYPIQIDGQFGDWPSSAILSQSASGGLDPDVDLRGLGVADNVDYLALYAQVAGQFFAGGGAPPRHDMIRWFVDTDRTATTGYSAGGIGADRMIEVAGFAGQVRSTRMWEWDSNRGSSDWNGWIKATGIEAASLGAQLEVQVAWDLLVSTKGPVFVYVHVQAHDSTSDEADHAIASAGPTLFVEGVPVSALVLSGSGQELLRVTIGCSGAPCSYSSLSVRLIGTASLGSVTALRLTDGAATVAQITSPPRETIFQFPPRALAPGAFETLTFSADTIGGNGETLGASISGPSTIGISDGLATARMRPGARGMGYLGFVPAGVRVDGGFADWNQTFPDPADVGRKLDVDLREYGYVAGNLTGYVYVGVSGRVLNGTLVPEANTGVSDSPGPGAPDSDRDTVPDISDPLPYDFNNDGVTDTASGNDYDGDGMIDYPVGPDWYLNTTIPGSFPPPHAGRTVALFIGPTIRPVLTGEDIARVYLEADNSTATGFRVNTIGADFLLEVRGRNGVIAAQSLSRFAGTSQLAWDWTPIQSPMVAKDATRFEASFSTMGLGFANSSAAYFEIRDWSGSPDGSASPSLQIGSAMTSRSQDELSPGAVETFDISGNEKWFFTDGSTTGSSCTSNLAASMTAGSSATSTTLSNTANTLCWFTSTNPSDTIAGPWEVILDIDKASDGTKVLRPDSNGDVNAWGGGGSCGGNPALEYTCVDQNPNDGDTTYIVSNSAGVIDSLFNIFPWSGSSGVPPSPLTIVSVQVEASCKKLIGAPVDVRIIIKSGGATVVGGTQQACDPSTLYNLWTETWSTDPADGLAWTAADIDALQIGVRDNDGTTREVRVSHVLATVTFVPAYTVQIDKCSNSACSSFATLYGPTNGNTYGSDVTFTTPSIAAQTFTGVERIRFLVQLNGTGTSQNHGSVTIRYNGPNPGTDDSRITVALPEFQDVAVPVLATIGIFFVARRRRHRRFCPH